ncbi:signal peptidase I [Anaerobacillus alkaliphilus]|uniref:Signal peptidase I n=1 Tax=Anaerobacillus alkaliphilus TaxID=1548597 RepID=A0A4Q0VYL0_9BACI|nr:signal peptidase I [Anaerobacillus alkaliphilus]
MKELFSWGKTIVFSLAIFIVISIFVFQPYTVNGSSMEPTFIGTDPYDEEQKGDRVFVSKSSYKLFGEPKAGDIIVIDSRTYKPRTLVDELKEHPLVAIFKESPDNYKWIKRVIGEPGDRLELKQGTLYRNGEELNEDYIFEGMDGSFEAITVPEDHVFVLGDNRNHSGDSRMIGTIPYENIVGKVMVRYFPFNKLNLF